MHLRAPTRVLRGAFFASALATLLVSACDLNPFASRGNRPATPEDASTLTVRCAADVRRGRLACDAPLSQDDGPRPALIGGQGVYVRLEGSNIGVLRTADAAVADTFAFDVTVQNLLNEAMGTADGVTPDPNGVRVVFHSGPVVTGTADGQAGTTVVANADGEGMFTASGQPFFRYDGAALGGDGMLTGRIGGGAGEVTGARRWKVAFSDNVTTFSFVVVVDAALQPLVAINEVMANPEVVNDSLGEYVELINRGTLSVNLNGWVFQDRETGGTVPGPAVTINQNLVVPGGRTVLLGRHLDAGVNGGIQPNFALPTSSGISSFSNSGGELFRIRTPGGVTVDSVGYGNTAVSAVSGQARERISFGAGSGNIDDGAFWRNAVIAYNGTDKGSPTPISGVTPGANGGIALSTNQSPQMPVGYDKPVFYTVRDSLGTDISSGSTITWQSLDPSVATVDSIGYVTGVTPGTATIRATASTGPTGTITFTVLPAAATHTATYRDHVEFGAPADATPDDEFRVTRAQFIASYNPVRRSPNWVAWNLNASQFEQGGTNDVRRCDCFTDEPFVAAEARGYDWDYRSGGYDRGHMVQSESRTNTFQENATTFLLSNILPQAAANNQGPWQALEEHLNALVQTGGKEVYVIAGGEYGASPPTLRNFGRVPIPEYTWKVALVVDAGEGLANVSSGADVEVVAVRMPNLTEAHASSGDPRFAGTNSAAGNIRSRPWTDFVTTVNSIEGSTGYDLLALLADAVENEVEARPGTGTSINATSLSITTEPSGSATNGVAFGQQPVVRVLDNQGNPFSASGRAVTASLLTLTGSGMLGGTATVSTTASGVATFSNLRIDGTGTFRIRFAATDLVPDTSVTITVTDAPPTVTSTSPSTGATGVPLATTVTINFSKSVTTTASAFTLACPAGTPRAFAVSGTGASRTLTPNAALPESTTCQVGVAASQVSDAADPSSVMAGDYAFSFTTAAATAGAAVLRINEINPSISSSRDLVELLVVEGGTVNGMRLMQDSATTLATLPNVTVQAGDLIVVHFNPLAASGDATTPETVSKGENIAATNYPNAWDFQGNTTGIGASLRTIRILSGSTIQDAVAAWTSTTAPGTWPRSLHQIQQAGQWLPVDCGGQLCTTTSTPTATGVSASWSGAGTSASGSSLRRVSATDTNTKDDWLVGASSFGAANP